MTPMKKILSLAFAATLSTSLVPTYAWAEGETTSGATTPVVVSGEGDLEVAEKKTGTITIANPKPGETYSVYKLFDLASFKDSNVATGEHSYDHEEEAYSYVIKADPQTSPWLDFLLNHGPVNKTYKYARWSAEVNGAATSDSGEYFIINRNAIELKTGSNTSEKYYVVTPTKYFANHLEGTDETLRDDTEAMPERGDDAGASVGIDYALGINPNSIVQDFAQEALKYAESTEGITPIVLDGTIDTSEDPIWSTTQPLGYYLVGTTMGTLAFLDTTNRDVVIYEKNDEPELAKNILKKGAKIDESNFNFLVGTGITANDWVECTDADFNDYVLFRTVITAQQGAKNYKLHDVMETGFTFVNEVKNSISTNRYKSNETTPEAITATYAPRVFLVRGNETSSSIFEIKATRELSGTTYTNWVLRNSELDDGCDFEIGFRDATVDTVGNKTQDNDDRVVFVSEGGDDLNSARVDIKDGDKIVVLYWAQVNKDAHVYGDTEANIGDSMVKMNYGDAALSEQVRTNSNTDNRTTNNTVLTYGNKSASLWRKAAVTTYQFDIVKTDTKTPGELLEGAKFSLYKAVENTNGKYQYGDKKYNIENGIDSEATAGRLIFKWNESANEYFYAGDSTTTAGTNMDDLPTVDQLTSKKEHEIHIEGLEEGVYILIEDKSPMGYNKLSQPVFITINGDSVNTIAASEHEGTISFNQTLNDNVTANNNNDTYRAWDATISGSPATYTSNAANQGGLQIVNQAGAELPSTGGAGTVAFYVVGGVLLVGSVVALVTKHRLKTSA